LWETYFKLKYKVWKVNIYLNENQLCATMLAILCIIIMLYIVNHLVYVFQRDNIQRIKLKLFLNKQDFKNLGHPNNVYSYTQLHNFKSK